MGLKPIAPVCHWYHFRDWRKSGVAYESRFSTYIEANRTLASYMPGKKVLFWSETHPGKLWSQRLLGRHPHFPLYRVWRGNRLRAWKN